MVLISLLVNSYHHSTRSYPPLWVVRRQVQRSRAVPLELEVVERPIANRNSSVNALVDMITFIRPHLSRCSSLHFAVRSPDAVATLYPLNGPFPHLQSLSLGPLGLESVQTLSESASPRTLMLAQNRVPHSLQKFDCLSLRSFDLSTSDGVGLQDALQFLSHCGNLETLVLHDNFGMAGMDEIIDEESLDPITLSMPNLRVLRLTGVALLRSLSRWCAPRLQHLALAEDEPFTFVFDTPFSFPNLETVSLELLHQSLVPSCLKHLTRHPKIMAIHLPSSPSSIVNLMLSMCMCITDPIFPLLRLMRIELEESASGEMLPALECFLRMRKDVLVQVRIAHDSDTEGNEKPSNPRAVYNDLEQKYDSILLYCGMHKPLYEIFFRSSN